MSPPRDAEPGHARRCRGRRAAWPPTGRGRSGWRTRPRRWRRGWRARRLCHRVEQRRGPPSPVGVEARPRRHRRCGSPSAWVCIERPSARDRRPAPSSPADRRPCRRWRGGTACAGGASESALVASTPTTATPASGVAADRRAVVRRPSGQERGDAPWRRSRRAMVVTSVAVVDGRRPGRWRTPMRTWRPGASQPSGLAPRPRWWRTPLADESKLLAALHSSTPRASTVCGRAAPRGRRSTHRPPPRAARRPAASATTNGASTGAASSIGSGRRRRRRPRPELGRMPPDRSSGGRGGRYGRLVVRPTRSDPRRAGY